MQLFCMSFFFHRTMKIILYATSLYNTKWWHHYFQYLSIQVKKNFQGNRKSWEWRNLGKLLTWCQQSLITPLSVIRIHHIKCILVQLWLWRTHNSWHHDNDNGTKMIWSFCPVPTLVAPVLRHWATTLTLCAAPHSGDAGALILTDYSKTLSSFFRF